MTTLLVALPGVQSGDGTAGVAAVQQPAAQGSGAPAQLKSGLISAGLVYETASFPSAHASTIVETGDGLVAAWFGGTGEGRPDVGIWVSRHERGAWTPPVEVATGVQPDGTRHPCWNPVLFAMPDKTLSLFYKVGPSPQTWWGMVRSSRDSGRTWSDARRLPDGILGPIKNKPVRLSDGTVISPSSTESTGRPSAWRLHFERSADAGATWTVVRPPAAAEGTAIDAIQPSILIHSGRKAPGRRTLALRARLRDVVERQRTHVDGGVVDGAAEPQLRDRCRDASRRPSPARVQPHAEGTVAAERRRVA